MMCSWRRVLNGLAIVLLLLVIVGELRGALKGSARAPAIVFSIVCILCCAGLYRDVARISVVTGSLLIILAAGMALVAWRFHTPALVTGVVCGAYAVVGVGLITAHAKRPDKTHEGTTRTAPENIRGRPLDM